MSPELAQITGAMGAWATSSERFAAVAVKGRSRARVSIRAANCRLFLSINGIREPEYGLMPKSPAGLSQNCRPELHPNTSSNPFSGILRQLSKLFIEDRD